MSDRDSGAAKRVDTKLFKIVQQAIEDLDDTKLEDGTALRGKRLTVHCFKQGMESPDVRLDNEEIVNDRPDGRFYKVVIQGNKGGNGSIGDSTVKRGSGPQYATVLVHESFGKGGLPKANVMRACLRSSSARCNENIEGTKKYVCMTVVMHANGAWINEATGEVGNVPDGAEPPVAYDPNTKKDDGKGKKKGKGGSKHR